LHVFGKDGMWHRKRKKGEAAGKRGEGLNK